MESGERPELTSARAATRAEASGKAASIPWSSLLAPLLVALPGFGAVVGATERASFGALGRDQGIFQYIAWATSHGDRAYRDVRDVNGPVITMVHAAFQALGARDEHRFRVLDLGVSAAAFAIGGVCLASAGPSLARRAAILRGMAWAAAAWVALSAQYLVYGFWDTAQRESFLDWFVLLSIALQTTLGPSRGPIPGRVDALSDAKRRTRALVLLAAGLTSFVPWLGKPTFALFTATQLVTLAVDHDLGPARARLRAIGVFCAGGLLGLLGPLLFLVVRGDLRAWATITFVDVPTMYRFIWPSPPQAILRLPGYATVALLAVVTSFVVLALVVLRRLPRRLLPVATMPLVGLASMLLQAKGFPYHFHPVTLGFTFAWLATLAFLPFPSLHPRRGARVLSLVVLAGALAVGVRATFLARNTPDPPLPAARDRASLESAERLAFFDRIDFFPRALRDAAAYIAARTTEADRVQTYGMDAYLLFLAERRSATPYVYSYDLNADAALVGSFDPEGLHPTAEQSAAIRAIRDAHAADLLQRLSAAPPAAFVFIDRSPLMSSVDAIADFSAHCPETARWLGEHYRQTAVFDAIHVWLRDDLAAREPERPREWGQDSGDPESKEKSDGTPPDPPLQ